MRSKEIEVLDYNGIPREYFRVGFIAGGMTCVIEKIVGEMSDGLKQNGVYPIMVKEAEIRTITDSFPNAIVYMRCGTYPDTPPNTLMMVDGHSPYFKNLKIPVFYYIDDAYFHANNDAPMKILLNTDQAIVASTALVAPIREAGFTKPIHLLKTHMHIPLFDVLPASTSVMDRDKFNILFTSEGRIGTVMIDKICERMSQTPEKYKHVRLLCITGQVAMIRAILNKWRGIEKVYYERVPLAEFYGLFKMMDLCLAPGDPEDLNYFLDPKEQPLWLASKSCVKYCISGAAQIPCIASSHLREYEMAIKHEKTGYMADNIDEWMHYIDLMITNDELRKQIGINARRDVVKNWNIIDRCEEFAHILKGGQDRLIVDTPKELEEGDPTCLLP